MAVTGNTTTPPQTPNQPLFAMSDSGSDLDSPDHSRQRSLSKAGRILAERYQHPSESGHGYGHGSRHHGALFRYSGDEGRRAGAGRTDGKEEGRIKGLPPLPIPDMRFEVTYLASLKGLIQPEEGVTSSATSTSTSLKGKEKESEVFNKRLACVSPNRKDLSKTGSDKNVFEVALAPIEEGGVRIDWKGVGWVTLRDQVLSPLLQGAVWGCASLFIASFLSNFKSWRQKQRLHRMTTKPSSGSRPGSGLGWAWRWRRGWEMVGEMVGGRKG